MSIPITTGEAMFILIGISFFIIAYTAWEWGMWVEASSGGFYGSYGPILCALIVSVLAVSINNTVGIFYIENTAVSSATVDVLPALALFWGVGLAYIGMGKLGKHLPASSVYNRSMMATFRDGSFREGYKREVAYQTFSSMVDESR